MNRLRIAQVAEVMQRLHGIAGQALPSSMLARSPTIQGLAETLAAIPPIDPQRQGSISRAPFTASQRAAGVPCAAMQEGAAHSYLVLPDPPLRPCPGEPNLESLLCMCCVCVELASV